MSRYNRRTFPTRNEPTKKTARFALHDSNPPGTKITRRARGRVLAHQFYFHGGDLIKAAAERSARRRARRESA